MSGIAGGKGSNSTLISNLSEPTTNGYGGLTILNYLICGFADNNMGAGPSDSEVTTFNANNDWENIRNPRNWIDPQLLNSYLWLFGPNYTSVDAANGGYRIGLIFRVPVRIEMLIVGTHSTNARPKHMGLFMRPNGADSATNQTFLQQSQAYKNSTVDALNVEAVNVFGSNHNFTSFPNENNMFQVRYNNAISQNFLLSFGIDVHNNGNTNAGLGKITFYGQALTN